MVGALRLGRPGLDAVRGLDASDVPLSYALRTPAVIALQPHAVNKGTEVTVDGAEQSRRLR